MGKGTFASAAVVVLSLAACAEHGESPQRTLYEGSVAPILQAKCVTSGCHDLSAAGALDLSSYEGIDRRRDLLDPDRPLLLQKADGTTVHAGGKDLEIGSDAYLTILEWIDEGAPR